MQQIHDLPPSMKIAVKTDGPFITCMYSPSRAKFEVCKRYLLQRYPPLRKYLRDNWFRCSSMWAGYERAGVTTSTNRIESANRCIQRDIPRKARLVKAIAMLVEKWEGQIDEALWQSTYDTENRVMFHGLEHTQSYLDQFTSYYAKTVYLNLQEDGSGWCSPSLNECSCAFFVTFQMPCRQMMNRALADGSPPHLFHQTSRCRLQNQIHRERIPSPPKLRH